MGKKALISVKLIPESSEVSSSQIEKEIKKKAQIPWCTEIEKVSIEEVEDCYEELREQGLSRKVARNVVKFYES
jgi:uncharacterized protein (UPF0335 family)